VTTKALLDRVYNEVLELHHHREIWRFLNEELPKHDGTIVDAAMTRWYVDASAAAVRRIAGVRSQDKQSMVRLLTVVRKDLTERDRVEPDRCRYRDIEEGDCAHHALGRRVGGAHGTNALCKSNLRSTRRGHRSARRDAEKVLPVNYRRRSLGAS
jgi:hypothetical protein